MESKQNKIEIDESQQQIVYDDVNSNQLIVACAGSGKTTTILFRVKHLIDKCGVDPEKIVITAFNIEAARTMQFRLSKMISSEKAQQVMITNIDKLAQMWLIQINPEIRSKRLHVQEFTVHLNNYIKGLQALRAQDQIKLFSKVQYFFFDQFQDITSNQYELLKNLQLKAGAQITVIGDDAQNIYDFRDPDNQFNFFQYFSLDFYPCQKFLLLNNYRSTPEIIQFANLVLKNSPKLIQQSMVPIFSSNIDTQNSPFKQIAQPIIEGFQSIETMNQRIFDQILDLRERLGVSLNDIAILARNNKLLQILQEQLLKFNQRYPDQQILFQAWITNNDGVSQNTQINTNQFYNNQNNADKDVEINQEFKLPKVVISTIHQVQGLEWDVVFLNGCNDDYFPKVKDEISIEQDRRVFYVAVTRAKKMLMLTYINSSPISRFVSEIKQEVFEMDASIISHIYQNVDKNCIIETKSKEYDPEVQQSQDKILIFNIKQNITEVISKFLPREFDELREKTKFDQIELKTEQLNLPYAISTQIVQLQAQSEFFSFIKIYAQRVLAEHLYRSMRKQNKIQMITNIECERVLFNDSKMMESHQLQNDPNIQRELINQILLGQSQYVDDEQILNIIHNSYQQFIDFRNESDSMLQEIFNVAICDSVTNDRQRVLFQMDQIFSQFLFSKILLQNLKRGLVSFVSETKEIKQIEFQVPIYHSGYQFGDQIDILINQQEMIEIKPSASNQMRPEWLIRLYTVVGILMSEKELKIKQASIYNPISGYVYSCVINDDIVLRENIGKISSFVGNVKFSQIQSFINECQQRESQSQRSVSRSNSKSDQFTEFNEMIVKQDPKIEHKILENKSSVNKMFQDNSKIILNNEESNNSQRHILEKYLNQTSNIPLEKKDLNLNTKAPNNILLQSESDTDCQFTFFKQKNIQ